MDFGNALQLDSKRADVHDRLALIYWQQNKHDEATREFKTALQAFAREEDGRIREDFWRSLAATLEDIGQCQVFEAVRPEADRVLTNLYPSQWKLPGGRSAACGFEGRGRSGRRRRLDRRLGEERSGSC